MVKKAKDKKTGEIVEYMVFVPEDIPEIEKWADGKFEYFDDDRHYVFKRGSCSDYLVRFEYMVKFKGNQIVIFEPKDFIKKFDKIDNGEPDAFDKALEEHPDINLKIEHAVVDYQAKSKVKAQKEFRLIPELEELLRYFEDAQHIILDNDPEKEQMRKDAATDALYNFCRGLVIGAKIARQ